MLVPFLNQTNMFPGPPLAVQVKLTDSPALTVMLFAGSTITESLGDTVGEEMNSHFPHCKTRIVVQTMAMDWVSVGVLLIKCIICMLLT